jgi:hypothetical protein
MIADIHWEILCQIAAKFGYSHLELRRVETYAYASGLVFGPRQSYWQLQCKYPAADSQGTLRMETQFYGDDVFALLGALIERMPADHTQNPRRRYC